ncbi:MAG: hypothetical protein ACKOSQ_11135 [Planctomycetaceae bacterium]
MTGDPSRLVDPVAAAGMLVVAIDRLPAWILPAYGATWVSMPRLTALAARGIVFDRVIAETDDPVATLADLLGGAGEPAPLVAAAAARGWRTALVTDDTAAAVAGADITRVFDPARTTAGHEVEATCLARLGAAARAAVAAGDHRLVIVHATSLGTRWDAPPGFREAYVAPEDPPPPPGAEVPDFEVAAGTDPDLLVGVRQAFAGQLTLLDRCLGAVIDAALASGWSVLVAGLRGLALGLHGHVGPGGVAPFGEIVHLPALLADAAGRMAGQRHGGLVLPADLGTTLVEALGGRVAPPEPGSPWRGASLAGLLESWTSPHRDRVVAVTRGGAAVVTPGWHCVAGARRVALHAKPDDYFELCDVADRCPEVAEELGGLAATAAAGDTAAAWRAPLSAVAVGGLG